MTKPLQLSSAANYSQKRIASGLVNIDNYISIDNILQNKLGITKATKLPPGNGSLPAYEVGNILIGNIRPYLKKIWFADKSGGCSPDVLNLEVKPNFDPKFVYYCLIRDDFFIHMMKGSKGSKMPRGDKDQIMDFLIPNFDFPTQGRISYLLSKIDEKIELNNKINHELEAVAKLIYDYWFIQFEFPDANGKPYKSSGGRFVYDRQLKREIPADWTVKPLNMEMNIQYGFPFKTSAFTGSITDKPIARIRDILDNTISIYSTENVDKKYMLNKGDLVIGMDGNFHINFWFNDGVYLNQRCVRVRPHSNSNISNYQVYFEIGPHIKSKEKNVSRTTVGHLSDRDIKDLYILVPNKSSFFNSKIVFDNLLDKVLLNRKENQELIALRSWLLPMLMNSQIKIENYIV